MNLHFDNIIQRAAYDNSGKVYNRPQFDQTLSVPVGRMATVSCIFCAPSPNKFAKVVFHRKRPILYSQWIMGSLRNIGILPEFLLELLFHLETAIKKSFLLNKYFLVVSLDFLKAYDKLWTNGLLYKLNSLQIKGNMFAYLRSFLENHTFEVRLHQTLSKIHTLGNGTHHAIVVSPTLFNIKVNNLYLVLTIASFAQFADYSSIWQSWNNITVLKYIIKI